MKSWKQNKVNKMEEFSSDEDSTSIIPCSQSQNMFKTRPLGLPKKRSITVVYDPPLPEIFPNTDGPDAKIRKVSKTDDLPQTQAENTKTLDSPLVVSNVLDWDSDQVKIWIEKLFDANIASNFEEQEVDGRTLLSSNILSESSLSILGLKTLGKKNKFENAVLELRKESDQENTCPSIKQLPKDTDRLLTNSEKKGMTCEEKAKYNTKKKMITSEILKEWPESNPIPTFRSNYTNEIRQLQQFQERLGDDEKYIYPEWSLGKNAIKEMVLKHMAERRRKVKNANIYHSGYTTTESETSSCDSPPSTLSSSPELDSKRKLWKDYFNQDLTQASCDTIILVALNKDHIRDIQMMKHLMPLKKIFKLSLLRGKDKNMFIRAIANSMMIENYIIIADDANLSNLKREDVKCVKQLSF